MISKRLLSILLLALGLALTAASCGDDDNKSDDSGSSSISKAEFVKKGNAICAKGNKEIDAQGEKMFGDQKQKPSDADLKKFSEEVLIPSVQKQVDGLRALGAPAGDEDEVNAILDAAQQGIDEGKKDPLALTQDNGDDPFQEANKLAREYGLTVCGSDN
ncbi:MAG TPA: hypothetical protein VJT75_01385 [Thermoleophilaceae bacterium]|nr:hypothetical protein [Thermoleophilaceae bacterium]